MSVYLRKTQESKLNLDKTEGMWFGSMAGRTDGPVNIKWRTDFIKVFGIFFTMSNGDFLSINWNFRIEKLAKRLESWKFRTLSLKGKSMIITEIPGTSREIYSEDADGETRTRNPWITNPVL